MKRIVAHRGTIHGACGEGGAKSAPAARRDPMLSEFDAEKMEERRAFRQLCHEPIGGRLHWPATKQSSATTTPDAIGVSAVARLFL